MTKFRQNNTLLFALIIAFLTMQWTAIHIHLAEDHNHDGGHHQHSIEAHAHQPGGHHADTIDSSHQSDDISIVELDPECSTASGKNLTPNTVAITLSFLQVTRSQSISVAPPVLLNTKLSHLYQSTVNFRAPPRFS